MVAIAQSVEHLIVVQEVARSSRVSHPTSNPYSRQGSRGFTVSGKSIVQTVLVCQLCAISGQKLATIFVFPFQGTYLALPGPYLMEAMSAFTCRCSPARRSRFCLVSRGWCSWSMIWSRRCAGVP